MATTMRRRRKRWRRRPGRRALDGPHGLVSLDLHGDHLPVHAVDLHGRSFTDAAGERIVFVVQGPASSPEALDALAGTSSAGEVRERLAGWEREVRTRIDADRPGFLRTAAGAMLGHCRQGLAAAAIELDGWSPELDATDREPGPALVREVPGGFLATHRVGPSDPLGVSSVAWMAGDGTWVVHLLAGQEWLDRNAAALARPTFGPPGSLPLVPFVARALELYAERLPPGWKVRLAAPEVDPDGMGWSFEIDHGAGEVWCRNLETMYLAYLNEGAAIEDMVEGTIAPADHVACLRAAMESGGRIELEVGRIHPILRNAVDLELYEGRAHLLSWPIAGDVIVTLAALFEAGGQMAWTLLTEEIVRRTVHRPETLLQMAFVNAEVRGPLPPPPWPGRGAPAWTAFGFPEETCSFLLARAGLAWADSFLADDDRLYVPARQRYLFGPAHGPAPDPTPFLERTRFPISAQVFEWAEFRDGVRRLDVRRGRVR